MDKISLLYVNTIGILNLYRKDFEGLLDVFYEKSASESNKERILKILTSQIDNPLMKLYFVLNDKYELVAYYILQLSMNMDSLDPECFVYQHCSKIGFIPEANKILEEKMVEYGIKRIKFITKRNVDAFLRSLNDDGFKIVGTVVEKKVRG